MERPLALPAPPPRQRGLTLSLGLHAALLLAAAWYAATRPVLVPPRFLPVDLVAMQPTPGTYGTSPAPGARANAPRAATAPRPVRGTRPNATTPAPDELTARLQALSQLRGADAPLGLDSDGGNGVGAGGGTMGLRDFIRAQIMRRWFPTMTAGRGQTVMLRVSVTNRGVIRTAQILIQPDGDQGRELAISARNAAILSSPVIMPPGNWPALSVLDMAMTPRDASR